MAPHRVTVVAMSTPTISTETPSCTPIHLTQATQNSPYGVSYLERTQTLVGDHWPFTTGGHTQTSTGSREHGACICWLFMLQLYAKSKPLPKARLKRPTSQKVSFRIFLVYTFTKHTGAGGQQEGVDSGSCQRKQEAEPASCWPSPSLLRLSKNQA